MTALIETIAVSKSYGDFVALDGVSLSVTAGKLVSIVGPINTPSTYCIDQQ